MVIFLHHQAGAGGQMEIGSGCDQGEGDVGVPTKKNGHVVHWSWSDNAFHPETLHTLTIACVLQLALQF